MFRLADLDHRFTLAWDARLRSCYVYLLCVDLSPPHLYIEGLTPVPWNVTLFADRVFTVVIRLNVVIREDPTPVRLASFLLKKEKFGRTSTHRENPIGRGQSDTSTSLGTPKVSSNNTRN